jgi:AhpD family alkylhydroperoxidase
MQKRLDLYTLFPDVFRLNRELDASLKSAGINPLYFELIRIHASQLNGCAYCLDKHTGDALKLGEDPRRIHVLSAWREAAEWFSEEEQTILQLTEEITMIGNHGISEKVYNKAIELFGEDQYALLMVAAISINSWNRIGIGLSLHPKR